MQRNSAFQMPSYARSPVHRLDSLEAPRDPGNPFEFAGGRVSPALEQTVKTKVGEA